MKTLFIFGNGFDLNLGLKTDFPSYLRVLLNNKKVQSPTQMLQHAIFENEKNWADFEYAFGKYTDRMESEKEFIQVYKDIISTLADHLESEEKKLESYVIDKNKIRRELANPISLIPTEEGRSRQELISFRGSFNVVSNVNIITFNYTLSLEHIFESNDNIALNTQRKIDEIHHVHGDLRNRMILGVNDISQIGNTLFKENQDVLSRFIKNQVNQISGDLTYEYCNSLILSSNLIVLFGVSIGLTDRIWWDKISDRLKSDDFKLLIFHYESEPFDQRIPAEKLQIQEKVKEKILGKKKEKSDTIETIKNNIHVIVNGPFLRNIYTKEN